MPAATRRKRRQEREPAPVIPGDRRRDRRYQLALDLRYRLIHRGKLVASGAGKTIDMSGGGVLIETPQALPDGLRIELSIAWPVRLRDTVPLQLVATGKVVRNAGTQTAIHWSKRELRTWSGGIHRETGNGLHVVLREQFD